MIFGGLLENQSSYDKENTVYVDCREAKWSHSSYCDGSYESQTQENNFKEDSYYQNIVR